PRPDMARFGGGNTPGLEKALEEERRREAQDGRGRRGDHPFFRRNRRLFMWLLGQSPLDSELGRPRRHG
ncbi:hypothetical protein, partial [Nonomuraea sp. NPDC049784]|uniref:hypothetical protein n=1 Tax=Nonomuraea sp. NPDC049784 TaxID=3154361 RepID=UPI0033C41596